MKRILMLVSVCIAMFTASFIAFAASSNGGMSVDEIAVVEAINDLRASQGLQPLQPTTQFLSGARDSANAQSRRRQCGHFVGLNGAGEICARTSGGARHAARMWLNSSGHRRIMMNPSARTISVGVTNGYYAARIGRSRTVERSTFNYASIPSERVAPKAVEVDSLQLVGDPVELSMGPYDEGEKSFNEMATCSSDGCCSSSPSRNDQQARSANQSVIKERRFQPFRRLFRHR